MERRTDRPKVQLWNTGIGEVRQFQLVAWKITIYPFALDVANPGTLVLNGVIYNGPNPIILGGVPPAEGRYIPVLFEGNYSTNRGNYLVVSEHLDPDAR